MSIMEVCNSLTISWRGGEMEKGTARALAAIKVGNKRVYILLLN